MHKIFVQFRQAGPLLRLNFTSAGYFRAQNQKKKNHILWRNVLITPWAL